MVGKSLYLWMMGCIIPPDYLIIQFIQPIVAKALQRTFESFFPDPQTTSVNQPKAHFEKLKTISLGGRRELDGSYNVTKGVSTPLSLDL